MIFNNRKTNFLLKSILWSILKKEMVKIWRSEDILKKKDDEEC